MENFKKTRIAPTPSGFLHLGNVFSFALTAALGRQRGASILLRIDDLDRARVNHAYIDDVFSTLHFMGIPWDEGPTDAKEFLSTWSQLSRMDLYRAALEQLRAAGAVFACSCSRSAVLRSRSAGLRSAVAGLRSGVAAGCPGGCSERGLSLDASGVAWRLKTDLLLGELRVRTIDGSYVDAVLPGDMRDFVVKKKDGFPAYQLTSLVDDVHYGVDLIVRGADLWPSTLAQHGLSYALGAADSKGAAGFSEVAFYHHALLLREGGGKLSKSAGDTSIRYLRQSGFGPGVIYSLILRMMGIDQAVSGWAEFWVRLGV